MKNFREKSRWLSKIFFYKFLMPEQITFFVTNRCNLHCSHCFYSDKLNTSPDSSLEEIKLVADSIPSFSFLSLTGGEPFLRDDIAEICKIFYTQNKVSRISIPTNGYYCSRIYELTEQILINCPHAEVIVKISIDGSKEVHDNLRNKDGSFEKALNSYQKVSALKEKYKNLRLGLLVTITKANQNILRDTIKFIKAELDPDRIGLNYVRGNISDPELKNVDYSIYKEIYDNILNDQKHKNSFYRSYKKYVMKVIDKIITSGRYPLKCLAGRVSLVIDAELNVYACEMLERSLGNLKDFNYNLKKILKSPKAINVFSYIKNSDCLCTNECNIQNNSFFNFKILFFLLLKYVLGRFHEN